MPLSFPLFCWDICNRHLSDIRVEAITFSSGTEVEVMLGEHMKQPSNYALGHWDYGWRLTHLISVIVMSQISLSKSRTLLNGFEKYCNIKCRNLQKALWQSRQAVPLLVGLWTHTWDKTGNQENESKLLPSELLLKEKMERSLNHHQKTKSSGRVQRWQQAVKLSWNKHI